MVGKPPMAVSRLLSIYILLIHFIVAAAYYMMLLAIASFLAGI
jgi:hypothetical protein